MKKVIIGCSVLRKEVESFLGDSTEFEFKWMEDQLHNVPETLHQKVQAAIDECTDADQIYLIYGHCGQALCGVTAKNCSIIIPKVEDCIEIMLYNNPDTAEMRRTSYFVSQGWLWGEEGLGYEYDRMKEKYNEKRALRVIKAMYKNYNYLMLIKTGLDDDLVRERCIDIAEKLDLGLKETDGSIALIEAMLKGAVDGRYLVIKPGEYITEEMFRK